MAVLSLLVKAIVIATIAVVGQYILAYLRSPLKKIPGPFLAKFSNFWRLYDHYCQTHIETQKKLHEKYGDIVRLGPTTVSVADPNLLKTIYNTRGTFVKSDYYSVNDALSEGHILQNLFSTRSNEFNARGKKPVHKLYNIQNALQLETLMDDDVRVFCSELESRYMTGENKGKTCEIDKWLSYFAWDVLGHVTWSKRMGFMEQGEDVGGMLKTAENVMRYFSVVGQIPSLDKWLGKNPYLPPSIYKFDDFSVAAGFSVERFMERMQKPELNNGKNDFLNGFLQAKKEFPELTDHDVIGYMIINVLGGADTLAIVIKALFYHILKNPSVKAKLVAELRAANLSFPASYKSLEALPYLSACISEGLRIHPVIGHILERVVPASGYALPDGTLLPGGTIIGANPWLIHSNPTIFTPPSSPNTPSPPPSEFSPSRWLPSPLESTPAYTARLKAMRDADLSFGAGNRACLARPLATMELFKIVGNVFARYDVELVDPRKEWRLNKQWFVWVHGVEVRLRARGE